jgi:hypothetical protein
MQHEAVEAGVTPRLSLPTRENRDTHHGNMLIPV